MCYIFANMFNVVLVNPEIPNNTGCVGRTCLGVGSRLHLVEPLGFELTDRSLKRAGLDYWRHVDCAIHHSWDAFLSGTGGGHLVAFSSHASESYLDVSFQKGDFLVFGCESRGLPAEILQSSKIKTCKIPISSTIRSLNLATAVGIGLFEAIRQVDSRPKGRLAE